MRQGRANSKRVLAGTAALLKANERSDMVPTRTVLLIVLGVAIGNVLGFLGGVSLCARPPLTQSPTPSVIIPPTTVSKFGANIRIVLDSAKCIDLGASRTATAEIAAEYMKSPQFSLDDLVQLRVPTVYGGEVSLSDVARVEVTFTQN